MQPVAPITQPVHATLLPGSPWANYSAIIQQDDRAMRQRVQAEISSGTYTQPRITATYRPRGGQEQVEVFESVNKGAEKNDETMKEEDKGSDKGNKKPSHHHLAGGPLAGGEGGVAILREK